SFNGGPLADLGLLDGAGFMKNELQAAQDAEFNVNGIDVTRGSNTISDAVSGVTFELKSVGSAAITISRDTQNTIAKVKAFVAQYNSTQDFLADKTAQDAILQGDSTLIRLQSTIRLRAMDSLDVPP